MQKDRSQPFPARAELSGAPARGRTGGQVSARIGSTHSQPWRRDPAPAPIVTVLLAEDAPSNARYRYRTCVLVGPWRSHWDEAEGDAVRARQACFDPAEGFSWSVAGLIEIGCPAADDEIVAGHTAH